MKGQWGHIMGEAHGVPAYSNINFKYDPQRVKEFQSYLPKEQSKLARDVYLGFKYQCVEYARRFLVHYFKVAFNDIHCAYDIWPLNSVEDLTKEQGQLEFKSCPQGGTECPIVGDLLIYYKSHEQPYGHVAVVINVGPNFVELGEQNYEHHWNTQQCSRRLLMNVNNGRYEITNQQVGERVSYEWDRHEKLYGWKRVIKL